MAPDYERLERPRRDSRTDSSADPTRSPVEAPRPKWSIPTDDQFARMTRTALAEHLTRWPEALDETPRPLPFLDLVQQSFGTHDVSAVQAFSGATAARIVDRFDARALAVGDRVLFRGTPDLHTVAHEAAHVIQQRRGVQSGADHEAHADRVADLVVAGRSAASLLDRSGTGAGGPAIQLKSATAPASSATWNPDEAFTLLPGHRYQSIPGAYGFVVDTAWYRTGVVAGGDGLLRAPDKNREILAQLRSEGLIGWASDAGIELAASRMGMHATDRPEMALYFAADIFGMLGLPPTASAMVTTLGIDLQVALRFDTRHLTSGDTFEATGETVTRLYEALDLYTGLHGDASMRLPTVRLQVGDGAVYRTVPHGHLERVYGSAAWQAWLASHGTGKEHRAAAGGTGATIVSSALSTEELAWLSDWARTSVPAGTAGSTPMTRELYVTAREIEASEYRDEIHAHLRSEWGPDHALDARSLQAVQHQAIFDARRAAALHGDLHRNALASQTHVADVDPVFDFELPAQLRVHAGLVVDGDEVEFSVEVDWSKVSMDAATQRRFDERRWELHTEWSFEAGRVELAELGRGAGCTHTLPVLPGQASTVWSVLAFVRTSHFWPTQLGPVLVEVKSAARRMADLEGDLLGPEWNSKVTSAEHDFDIGFVDDAVSDRGEDHGQRYEGPLAFTARTAAERASARTAELERLQATRAYFEGHPGKYQHAIDSIDASLSRLRAEAAVVEHDEQTMTPFEVKATYFSREPATPSGALQISGVCTFHPFGPSEVEACRVVLHDTSRRFGHEMLTFESGLGHRTFESALEEAFVDLCKSYPTGTIALFAEQVGESASTNRMIGFELPTTSAVKRARELASSAAGQVGMAVATVLGWMFPPVGIVVELAMLAMTVDQMREQARSGTLTTARLAVGLGQLAMTLVGNVRSAQSLELADGTRFLVDLGTKLGGYAVIAESVKERVEAMDANEVAVLSEMYADLVEMELTSHASDPGLAARRSAIQARAEAAGHNLMTALDEEIKANAQSIVLAAAGKVRGHLVETAGERAGITAHEPPEPGTRDSHEPAARHDDREAAIEHEATARGEDAGASSHDHVHRPDEPHVQGESHGTAPHRTTEEPAATARDSRARSEEQELLAAIATITIDSDPTRAPGAQDRTGSLQQLGLQFAATIGAARYAGDGVFILEAGDRAIAVKVQRTTGAASVLHRGDHWVAKVPRGLVGMDFERAVVGAVTEARYRECALANGERANRESALGEQGTGDRLSPGDMNAVAQLRVLHRTRDEMATRGASGEAMVEHVDRQIAILESQLGLHGTTAEAARRRTVVETQIGMQSDAARRSRAAIELEGTHGHPGIDLHTHLTGVVSAEVFRLRADVAANGRDTGSWIPLLKRIAALKGPSFEHERDSEQRIVRRAASGDAVYIAKESLAQVGELLLRATDAKRGDGAAYLRAAEFVANEAVETALSATPETDFNSAYEVRDQLIKDTFGSTPVAERTTQDAYDDYLREAVLQFAKEGIAYVETSISAKKAGGTMSAARVQLVVDQLVAEGRILPGQVDVRILTMMHTRFFGERAKHLPAVDGPERSKYAETVELMRQQLRERLVVGSDVAGAEHFDWDGASPKQIADLYALYLADALRSGDPIVLRPHVGEGAVDTEAGKPFHTDTNRHLTADGELPHYARASANIEKILIALEGLRANRQLDPTKVIVRFGHATHATPDQVSRLTALGVVVEVNLHSNVATGSLSQTAGAHGPRSPVDLYDAHSFASLIYYDVPIAISTDSGPVMGTSLRGEYQQAKVLLEEVLSGDRKVRVRAEDVRTKTRGEPDRFRGTPVEGHPGQYELSISEMTPAERSRFMHGYEKLFTDAREYASRRPKPGGTGAESARPGVEPSMAHHVDTAVGSGLVPSRGTAIFEGVRADVLAAADRYRAAGYWIAQADLAGGRVVIEVTSPDGSFATTLRSWDGSGPSYVPMAPHDAGDRPIADADVLSWYRDQIARIARLDHEWRSQGVALEERARRAFEVRKAARLGAREQMSSEAEVAALEARDVAVSGAPDGPTFEGLVESHLADGMTREQAYEKIIASAQHTNTPGDRRQTTKEQP